MNVADLIAAVKAGDLAKTRAILDARPELISIDISASNEHRALHYAVLQRNPEMVRLLMKAGANARKGIYPHRDATSGLTMAREREYTEIVAIIEESEEEAKQRVPGSTPPPASDPFDTAIAQGKADRVRELLQADPGAIRKIKPNGGLLTQAVRQNQLEIVSLLLDLGADPDERLLLEELEQPTPSWGMPLWHAALGNQLDIARLLLDRGADPNANVYASGWPLRNAWNHKDDALRNLLLERGAKRQPYMLAESHDIDAARQLLETDWSEELARELAWSSAHHGCPEILELALPRLDWPRDDPRWHWILIQPVRGADADLPDLEGQYRCLTILLGHVDPNVARYGQTTLHFTAGYNRNVSDADRARFTNLLIDHDARFDLRDDLLKSTALGWACRWNRTEMADTLIARGAPFEEPDAEPWATPAAWLEKARQRQESQ